MAFLIVNPRSGENGTGEELLRAAAGREIECHVLRRGDDAAELARRADADVLGVAGGDGSLAAVAAVAIERDLPFVCVPAGRRNHFARDAGLDRRDPVAALAAFRGVERRIDIGRVNGRVFLNNVSLGLYADLVQRREQHRGRGASRASATGCRPGSSPRRCARASWSSRTTHTRSASTRSAGEARSRRAGSTSMPQTAGCRRAGRSEAGGSSGWSSAGPSCSRPPTASRSRCGRRSSSSASPAPCGCSCPAPASDKLLLAATCASFPPRAGGSTCSSEQLGRRPR